ncbi:MAG: sarcosine oxidase subunit gamma [Rhodobacteraceae bacterium]|nr:MAG: sarcosine oxidase subunit gamma [Paracoccaceae bacterium]
MSEMKPVSALGGAAVSAGLAVGVEEVGLRGMVTLKGDLADPAFREAVEAVAGVGTPGVRKIVFEGDRALAWMAPDELLMLCPYAAAPAAVAELSARLAGVHHLALDVSDARASFRLTGAGARAVIAKGAPVDLSRGAFGPGDLRRSHLGQVAAAFWQASDDPEVFELVCFRSVAGYVFDWLVASAAADAVPAF